MGSRPLGSDIREFDEQRELLLPYGFACEKWIFRKTANRPDRHNEIEWNFLPKGSITYLIGGHRVEVPPERMFVFWAARPHQVVAFRLPVPYFVVTLPLAMFLQWKLPGDFVDALLHGSHLVEPRNDRAVRDREMLEGWYEDLQGADPLLLRGVQLEMQARLLRLACTSSAAGCGQDRSLGHIDAPEGHALSKAEEIALFVAKNCTAPIRGSDIGKAVGVHPDYAARLFRKAFGTTLNQYLIENRIFQAQHLLLTTKLKILDVCFRCGYQSLAPFNAAFKATCGCTPREFRRRHQVSRTT
jgi:AraC-like DNA-binding protein